MYGCQQVLLHPPPETQAVLEFICSEVNKLTNCGIYYARQLYFKTRQFIRKFDLDKELKTNLHFKSLRANVAQQALHKVYDSFKSYQALAKKWFDGELENKPRLPNYRKRGGLDVAVYPARFVKCLGEKIRLGLGRQIKVWFGIDNLTITLPSNLDFQQIKEVRILPRNNSFYAEFVYQIEESYTSKTSFFDNDFLPKFGEKPNRWKASGKRGKKNDGLGRGQYQTATGIKINSDCNGAANILRKVSSQLKLSLAKVCRAVLSLPKRYDLTCLSKLYRKQSEERGFNPLRTTA